MNVQQLISNSVEFVKQSLAGENLLHPDELRRHVRDTYRNLRWATGLVGIAFPLVLWFWGLSRGIELQDSISDYYHTGMRSVFVGILLAVGAILIIYKGYTSREDWVLNIAGVFAFGIAIFPTEAPTNRVDAWSAPIVHGVCAVGFFLFIAYVCIRRSRDTLDHLDSEKQGIYQKLYMLLGVAMIVLPISAAILLWTRGQSTVVFWVEFAAVWVFAIYWIVKSFEVYQSLSDYAEILGAPKPDQIPASVSPEQAAASESEGSGLS